MFKARFNRFAMTAMSLVLVAGVFASSNVHAQSASASNNMAAKKLLLAARIKQAETQIAVLKERRKELREEFAQLKVVQQDLQKQHDKSGISGESFGEVIKSLQAKRVDLMIDIAGLNARRETVMQLRDEMEKGSKELMAELSDLLQVEEDRLAEAEALYKKKALAGTDFQKAKTRVLEVRIRIAEARQPGKSSTVLTDQLLNTSLERAEKKARLEKTEALLSTFTSSRKTLDQANDTERRIVFAAQRIDENAAATAAAKANLDNLMVQLEQLERDLKDLKEADK